MKWNDCDVRHKVLLRRFLNVIEPKCLSDWFLFKIGDNGYNRLLRIMLKFWIIIDVHVIARFN
jgi:hypothetical protein